jgi:hypothetical protein
MQPLAAGPQILDLTARDERGTGPTELPRIQITVPDGWSNFHGWALGKKRPGDELDVIAVSFWDVAEVDAHPCEPHSMIDPGRLSPVLLRH